MAAPIVTISNLKFAWPGGPDLLNIEQFELASGERLFLRGPSGSGKSTLLGLIAGILDTSIGQLEVVGKPLSALTSRQRDTIRADHLGVIFQMFNLVPYLSVAQNVALPCQFSKARRAQAENAGGVAAEAARLLASLGLKDPDLLSRRVVDLSVGQQQRVAAARALIGGPQLIIADEPTSALDADSRDRFIQLLSEEATASGAAMLFVSHDQSLASLFDRSIDLLDLNRAKPAEALA